MSTVIVTGSGGLIGAETVRQFSRAGHTVVGVDNDMRAYFFGADASTRWSAERLREECPNYRHHEADIRDYAALERVFAEYKGDMSVVVHTAAQPSHDWAAREPLTDFGVNATGTLHMLELTRLHAPEAVFIFTSTNKVYGDTPNLLPLVEQETRWEVDAAHPYAEHGIDETMSIDQTKHSVFGASKVAADVMVQEYGRYFDMPTCALRGGCLTGPNHCGVELHGFLSYLIKCNLEGRTYKVFGYKGKQVRDNIHSHDVVQFMRRFIDAPRKGEVYNLGGGRANSVSILEAFDLIASISGKQMNHEYVDQNRAGDHICYISNLDKMKAHYPGWKITRDLKTTFVEIHDAWVKRKG